MLCQLWRCLNQRQAKPRFRTHRWAVGPISTAAAGMSLQRTGKLAAIGTTWAPHCAYNSSPSKVVVARVTDQDPRVARVVQTADIRS